MCVQLLSTALAGAGAYYTGQPATGAAAMQNAGYAQAAFTAADAIGDYAQAQTRARMMRADAAGARIEGEQRAKRIRKAGADAVSEARGKLTASGIALTSDSALEIERAIVRGSEQDAGVALLTGNNRAAGLELSGQLYRAAGQQGLVDGLLTAGSKWKRSRSIGRTTAEPTAFDPTDY